MKAAGVPNKCTPGRNAGHADNGRAPAHVPVRRAVATPSQRAEGGADARPDASAVTTRPLDPLLLHGVPDSARHVLHIDSDSTAADALALLLMSEARVTHVPTLAAAREMLQRQVFAAVVLDPTLPDGDGAELLPALAAVPLLVYSAQEPSWRGLCGVFLPKPSTSPRLLWTTISALLGISTLDSAGD
jgi:CheY-like chemotaxis protein